jgi:hypothetical protein
MKVPNVALDRTMILLHYRMSVIFGALQFRSTPTSAMTRLIAPEMRISVIAGAIAVLPWMWMALPAKAEDVTPVNAAMTVYKYVVGVETLIDECRQIDGVGGVSYDGLKTAYIKLMQSTVVEIGFLAGLEAKRSGVERNELFDFTDHLSDLARAKSEQMAHKDNSKFVEACRALSSRFNARTAPFEAPSTKFPKEMRIIESWLGKNKIQ